MCNQYKGEVKSTSRALRKVGYRSVDDQFDDSWKEYVEIKVAEYNTMSRSQKDEVLDRRYNYPSKSYQQMPKTLSCFFLLALSITSLQLSNFSYAPIL